MGWRKRTPDPAPTADVPDDIHEARAMRAADTAELRALKRQAPLVERMTDTLIDRQGKNHYIELLYHHVPRGAS